MGKINLTVMGNTPYLARLADYISKKGPEYLEVAHCTDETKLQKLVQKAQPDILLHTKSEGLREMNISCNTVQILLSGMEKTTEAPDKEKGKHAVIFRYQNGQEIVRQIFQVYQKLSDKEATYWCRHGNLKITAVYTSGGHDLQLPFSMAYAAYLGDKYKVLYINLAEFSGMNQLLEDASEESFSDCIYGVRQKMEQFSLVLQGVLHHTEVFDYIRPPQNPQDLYEMDETDLTTFINLLEKQTDYGALVFNFGTWNPLVEQMMKYCSMIICPMKENVLGRCRKEDFERYLEKRGEENFQKKIKYVSLPTGITIPARGQEVISWFKNSEFAGCISGLIKDWEGWYDTGDGRNTPADTGQDGYDA